MADDERWERIQFAGFLICETKDPGQARLLQDGSKSVKLGLSDGILRRG